MSDPADPPPPPAIADGAPRPAAPVVAGRGRGRLLLALAVLAVVLAGAWVRWSDRLGWRLVVAEDFAGSDWRQRWVEPPSSHGMFAVRDGRLVSTAERDAFLILRRRLTTPVAIEYSGEMLAGSQPCDLSLQWSENDGVAEDPARFAREGRSYMIQAGAFGNSLCAIFVNPGRRLLAYANRQLEPGRRYRFRVELDGQRIAMAIDGATVLECSEDIPTRSGFVALYGFYPGKAFSDVRVWQREPANAPTPFDAGDSAFLERRFDAAAGQYARLAEAAGATPLAQQALYRQGLAEWSQGDAARAGRTWDRIGDPALAARVACVRLEDLFNSDQRTPHRSRFEDDYRDHPERREELRRTWRMIVQQQLDAPARNLQAIDYFLDLRTRLFPDDAAARYVAATTLLALRRYAAVLDGFPEQRNPCARAMLALGRSQQILDTPWIGSDEHNHALVMRGDFATALRMPGSAPPWRARNLVRMGRAAEALAEGSPYPALLHLGRAAELLESGPPSGAAANEALICLGRLEEAAGDGLPRVPGSGADATAMLMLGQVDLAERVAKAERPAIRFMQAAERGDDEAYARLHARIDLPPDLAGYYGWFPAVVVLPVVDRLHGDPAALERGLRPRLDLLSGIYARTPWFVARAILGDAPLDELDAMPAVNERAAWRALAEGVRAELAGRPADAVRAYAAFRALPMHQRLLDLNLPDADVEWFVAWRLRTLHGGAP